MIVINDDNILISEYENKKGYKIRTFIENLPETERKNKNAQLAQDALKILHSILHKRNKKFEKYT